MFHFLSVILFRLLCIIFVSFLHFAVFTVFRFYPVRLEMLFWWIFLASPPQFVLGAASLCFHSITSNPLSKLRHGTLLLPSIHIFHLRLRLRYR